MASVCGTRRVSCGRSAASSHWPGSLVKVAKYSPIALTPGPRILTPAFFAEAFDEPPVALPAEPSPAAPGAAGPAPPTFWGLS